MKPQSLSVCVPAGCVNKCEYCVAWQNRQEDNTYTNQFEQNRRFTGLYREDFARRLTYARNEGCNVCMLTSTGEALLNPDFLDKFGMINKSIASPFVNIELQTSGTKLDDELLRFLRNDVGVATIALSLSSLDSDTNAAINRTPSAHRVDIERLTSEIKRYDFNLRLCLNMSDAYDNLSVQDMFEQATSLGANQLTFRKLYISDIYEGTTQGAWIESHPFREGGFDEITRYVVGDEANSIKGRGVKLYRLPFGADVYSVDHISVVIDDDCMNKVIKDDGSIKYLILRPDCRLYCRWDDKGSLVF